MWLLVMLALSLCVGVAGLGVVRALRPDDACGPSEDHLLEAEEQLVAEMQLILDESNASADDSGIRTQRLCRGSQHASRAEIILGSGAINDHTLLAAGWEERKRAEGDYWVKVPREIEGFEDRLGLSPGLPVEPSSRFVIIRPHVWPADR